MNDQLINLSIKRKVIKSHGTDEVDVSGLTVHDLLVPGDPQSGVLGEHLHNLGITTMTRSFYEGSSFFNSS